MHKRHFSPQSTNNQTRYSEINWNLFNILYRYFGLFVGIVWAIILYLQNIATENFLLLFVTVICIIVFNLFNTRFLVKKNYPLVGNIFSFLFNNALISLLVYFTGECHSILWVMYLIPIMALAITGKNKEIYSGIMLSALIQIFFYYPFLFSSTNYYWGPLFIKIGTFFLIGIIFKKAADLERMARIQEAKKTEELTKTKNLNQDIIQELIKSEEKYRELFENANDIIFTLDSEGSFTSANLAACQLWDTSKEELEKLNISQVVSDSEQIKIKEILTALAEGKVIRQPFNVKVLKKDKSEAELEIKARSVFRNKQLESFEAIARDVTTEKQLQQQFLQSEKMSALGEVISGVAHELNNPLTVVIGLSQILERISPEERENIISQIKDNALRCKRIIENLLTFAREYKSEKRFVNINQSLENILRLREYELKLDDIEIIRHYDGEVYTLADVHKLEQVFFNIINNAHQSLLSTTKKPKQIIVKIALKEDLICIEFLDTGPGIPESLLNKIFNPFFTTKDKGTGLGLSISYGIINDHNGNILAKNRPDGGAQFIIELPRVKPNIPNPHKAEK